MASFDRGPYQPPGDDLHVFDGGHDDDDVEGSRLPLLIVIALFVLAAFAGVVWLAYTQGVARGRTDAPRTIAALPGPARVSPDAGESQGTPYKGLKIYEKPAPADEESDQQTAPPPTQNPDVVRLTETPKAETPTALKSTESESVAKPALKVESPKEPPLSVAKSITPPEAKPAVAKPLATKPLPVEEKPAPKQVATAAPSQLTPKPVAAAASGGAYMLQIGSYKSEADAISAWSVYKGRHAGVVGSYGSDVRKVDLGAKGTWYRLRISSFASRDAAQGVCAKLTAEGGACFPAK